MGKIHLITGGSRSGKSSYALACAEELDGPRAFIATCPHIDGEMEERIHKHQQERNETLWPETIEEELNLAEVIETATAFPVLLVDCLTLWVNNLMFHAGDQHVTEEEIAKLVSEIVASCHRHAGITFFVTNELGYGIIPDSAYTRRYRDLVGRCNQVLASAADCVTLVACGCPLILKGES